MSLIRDVRTLLIWLLFTVYEGVLSNWISAGNVTDSSKLYRKRALLQTEAKTTKNWRTITWVKVSYNWGSKGHFNEFNAEGTIRDGELKISLTLKVPEFTLQSL